MMIWTRNDWMTKPLTKTSLVPHVEECIYQEVDGFYVWWPRPDGGFITSYHLRNIANRLDELNKDWEDKIDKYFEDQEYAARGYSSY